MLNFSADYVKVYVTFSFLSEKFTLVLPVTACLNQHTSHSAFASSKLTIEILEQVVKCIQS